MTLDRYWWGEYCLVTVMHAVYHSAALPAVVRHFSAAAAFPAANRGNISKPYKVLVMYNNRH